MWLTSANLQYQTLGFKSFVVHTTTMERLNNKKQKKVVKVRQLDITQKNSLWKANTGQFCKNSIKIYPQQSCKLENNPLFF